MLSKNWVAMGGWLPFLLLASLLSTSLTVISPGTQAKIGVSIETANVFLAEAKGHLQSQADSLKALKKLGVRRKAYEFRKYTKLVGKVSAMLSAVSGFAAIFSVVSTFFMPSQLEVIQENFDKVNKKLDGLSTQMNSVKNELKSSIEFNSWITAYVDWELDIRHGDDKLNEMKNRLRNTDNERDRLKLFETYVNHFEAQNIDGKSDKVYHLTALESTTTKNLFQLFREEKGCDIFQLSQFMSVIQITMTSAATQSAIYEFLKHGEIDYVQKRIMLYYKKLYEIRHRFDSEIWYCYRDYKATMDSEVTKIVMDNKQSSQETLTYKLHERLSGLMPWYGWAVVAYNKDEPSSTNSECFNAKGSHQYTIFNKVANTDNKNFIVVWQDIDDRSNGCRDLEDAQVFISFQYCSGCNSDAVRASDNIITGKECMDYYKTITLECISPLQEEKPNTSFIAASFSSSQNPCETSNMCNSHGICKHIPSTRNALCLCNEYYEGDKCEKFINPATGNKIIEMLSSLRLEFAQFSGLPTVIDVYLSIQEIPKQLELMRQRLTSSIKFSQILTLFGQDFTDAEYILVTYKTFQTGLIDEQTFSDRLSKLNMHRIQNGIKSAILGSSFLLSGDFMTVYKKSIIAEEGDNFACTSQYSKLVSLLRNNLVLIDQSLSEVKLWNSYGNSQKLTEENQDQNILTNAENELKASKERKIMYKKFWSSTSCPKLNSLELKEHFCEDYHSYEGLQVPLSCDNEKFPTPGSVTCSKNGVELKWSSSPVCLYQWSSWSSWSSCSMTCGGGISTRRRTKPNGDVDVDTSQINCNKEHCCQHQYGNFQCKNRQCTKTSQVCDGHKDCSDGSDEGGSCSYLKVGDTLALKNHCNGFLSCYCSAHCDENCKSRGCPGNRMDWGDWTGCSGEVFNYIVAIGKKPGDAIRHGDIVALRYGNDVGDKGWWLSCWGRGSSCRARPCPGYMFQDDEQVNCRGEIFQIFSMKRRGVCSSNVSIPCRGDLIHEMDTVFLRYTVDELYGGYWLSAGKINEDVLTRSCPGSHPNDNKCACERWTLFKKPFVT